MAPPGKSLVPVRLPAKRGGGRPSAYTPELAELICERIAGGETLLEICREEGMPKEVTVRGWEFDDRQGKPTFAAGFSAMYARAVEMRTEHELDKLRELAAKPIIGTTKIQREALTKDGEIVVLREVRRGDAVAARALEIDALKWRIAKMQLHRYGAKAEDKKSDDDADGEPPKLIIEGGLPDDEPEPNE